MLDWNVFELTWAVLEIVALSGVSVSTRTTSVKIAVAPSVRDASLQLILPVPFGAGVVQVQPAGWERD